MRYPTRVLLWILLFLGIVAGVAALLYAPLKDAFLANPIFNGLILAVLAVGLLINMRQVLVLGPDAAWIRAFRASKVSLRISRGSAINSLVRLLTERAADNLRLSTLSTQALLDGIRARLDESRDLSRYIIGLLIFLGLLGTFWGLLDTLGAIGGVIRDLEITGAEAATIFDEVRSGLEAPLSGMGTAFSSSLFGLAGALVLGFVDLQTGHAQNRFYGDVEEWLSGLTHYSSGGVGSGEDDSTVPAYIQALLEQTADSLDRLQRALARSEDERRSADRNIVALAEQVTSLAEQARSEQKTVLSLVRGQTDLQPVLVRLVKTLESRQAEEAALTGALEGLEQHLGAIFKQLHAERGEIAQRLADEVRLLTRTLSRAGEEGR